MSEVCSKSLIKNKKTSKIICNVTKLNAEIRFVFHTSKINISGVFESVGSSSAEL